MLIFHGERRQNSKTKREGFSRSVNVGVRVRSAPEIPLGMGSRGTTRSGAPLQTQAETELIAHGHIHAFLGRAPGKAT